MYTVICPTSIGSKLGQRRRRWVNIEPTFFQRLMDPVARSFSREIHSVETAGRKLS